MRLLSFLLTCFLLTAGAQTWGAESAEFSGSAALPEIENPDDIRLPADFSQVTFYLLTVDVGDSVYDNFGHSALRVVDEESGSDLVFNWGLFDVSGGLVDFATDFFVGNLNYQLGVSPTAWEFDRYRQQQRTIWQDRIVLTEAQKRRLYQRLAWNLRPENITYSYHYFFDNCTTRIRDYLNEALGDAIRQNSQPFVQRSYRDEVTAHYRSRPSIGVSLDVVTNSLVDDRMTQWQHMFLPLELRAKLLEFPSTAAQDAGELLSDSQIIAQFPPPEAKTNAYTVFAMVVFLPLLGLLLLLKRIPMSAMNVQPGISLKAPGLSFRVLGLVGMLVSTLSGGYGTFMAAAWLVSDHLILHHNLNLLLFWPTDIIGIVFSVRWLLFGERTVVGETGFRLISLYFQTHIVSALVYVLSAAFISAQQVSGVLFVVLPTLLCFTIVAWSAGFNVARPMRFF